MDHGSGKKKNTVEANRRIVTCKINKSRYEKKLLLSFISMYAQSNKEPWVPFWYYTMLVYRHFKWWTTIPKINHNQHDSHNSIQPVIPILVSYTGLLPRTFVRETACRQFLPVSTVAGCNIMEITLWLCVRHKSQWDKTLDINFAIRM